MNRYRWLAAVLVIAEMPGISPMVLGFADRVVALGCTAVLPDLFGDAGRDPLAPGFGSQLYGLSSMARACISREFTVFATGRSSPVVTFLRALAAKEHARCGGPGVGVVGMCFTGGFALAMAVDPIVLAPVMSQPSPPGLPRVDAATQKGRDELRRKVLQDELAAEEKLLLESRGAFANGAPPALADEQKDPQRYADRIAKLRQAVQLHERNVDALRRELGLPR
jgi:dienelactone hydrolase